MTTSPDIAHNLINSHHCLIDGKDIIRCLYCLGDVTEERLGWWRYYRCTDVECIGASCLSVGARINTWRYAVYGDQVIEEATPPWS